MTFMLQTGKPNLEMSHNSSAFEGKITKTMNDVLNMIVHIPCGEKEKILLTQVNTEIDQKQLLSEQFYLFFPCPNFE